MYSLFLFVLGALVGSFINVLAVRYDPDRFFLAPQVWSGRSRCPGCGKTLRFYELLPFVSFFIQRGRCRTCRMRISFQYPLAELVGGAIFASVPLRVHHLMPFAEPYIAPLWVFVFSLFLLLSLIDIRLHLIPDELQILLGAAGVALACLAPTLFLGPYTPMFGLENGLWLNRGVAVAAAAGFIGSLILLTRGRGMGIGDFKLAIVLGLMFGWPAVLLVLFVAFITGAIFGLLLLLRGARTLKSAVAFGPFLALGAYAVFMGGTELLSAYFELLI